MKFKSEPHKQVTVKPSKTRPMQLIKFNDKGLVDIVDKEVAEALAKHSAVTKVDGKQQ